MTSKQQREALEYFRKHAEEWRSKAEGLGSTEVNVIEQRNRYVLAIADENPAMRSFLDVGCGTGELVCHVARRGVDAVGVDYAQEMIDLASQKAIDEAVTQAKFMCCSIFDFEIPSKSYDLISANGFIEYISQQEMNTFFDLVTDALAPGGSFVVGSRNRLFNLVSMNDFTLQELEVADIELLIREAVKWTTAKRIADVLSADCAPLQAPMTEQAKTGIDVMTRFQYTPLQLIGLLRARGLQAVEVYPVHIHGVPPSFCETNAQIHSSIADLLQVHARHNTQLLVHASAFMLHVKKEE
ncbi:MAG: class I SAM-dependent methyltransferase [bacterium]|nr:class I SAM-dependent methyltransferase [bacterium]